jgi:hypothetical protein
VGYQLKNGERAFGSLALLSPKAFRPVTGYRHPCAIQRMRTVQEILPVAQGALCGLIFREYDGLDVMVAPLPAGEMPNICAAPVSVSRVLRRT